MSNPLARDVFDREFLTMRCCLLDLAAAIDRIGRADGQMADDPALAATPAGHRSNRQPRWQVPSGCI